MSALFLTRLSLALVKPSPVFLTLSLCTMAQTAVDEAENSGAFIRPPSTLRNFVSRDQGPTFLPESGRYRLYMSYACPWACRCLSFLKIKGLEKAISFTSVKPKWERTKEGDAHMGWVFPVSDTEEPDAEPDPLNGAKTVRELYELATANCSGKFTVPVLWNNRLKTILGNESAEIIRMLNSEFNDIAENGDCKLELMRSMNGYMTASTTGCIKVVLQQCKNHMIGLLEHYMKHLTNAKRYLANNDTYVAAH